MKEDDGQITYFATTNSRGKETPFGIKRKDRERHMYIIGKTGMGKSTLLENMAIQDIRNGEGMAFIDPHGGTADRIMEYVPAHRIRDVVYFAPFDMEYPVAFNVMEDVGYDKRHLVVSGLMSAFKKIWEDAWSARMEYILSNTLLALLEYPNSTLLDVNRMLTGTFKKTGNGIESVKDSNEFRYKVVSNIKDSQVRDFWVNEFYGYTERYIQEATPAIQNKVGQFTSNPLIRNIVGQAKSSFDIRQLMDEKKIFIINLSKGRVGESNAALLGSMLVTKIYLAAMSRADVPAETLAALPSFYFYVDEFQNFANESFSDILSEARKYKLRLTIAHQYIEQMEEEVRDAVFGNVGTTIAFRVGPFDAETLEKIFEPQFTATDLVNLGFAQIYLTLMIDGVGSPPFSATTMSPFGPPPERHVDRVLESSRHIFAKPRAEVERILEKWQAVDSEPKAAPKPAAPKFSAPPKPETPPAAPAPAAPAPVAPRPNPPVSPPAGEKPYARTEPPRQPHHHDPKVVGEKIAREHAMAQSKAMTPEPTKPRPAPAPAKPPLEGSVSLREALAMATGKPRSEGGGAHAPDLKDTLSKVAPSASAEEKPPVKPSSTPPSLPKEVLQAMLEVPDEK